MKKFLVAVLTVFAAVLCILPAFASNSEKSYIVSGDFANVYSTSSKGSFLFDIPGGTFVQVTKEENGFLFAKIPSRGEGWIFAAELEYAEGDSDTDIAGIFISSKPEKTTYIETEEKFDPSGLTVKANLKNGGERTITGYSVYTESFDSVGTKNVTVLYRPSNCKQCFTADFTVETVRIPVESLSADTAKMTTEYIENTPLDLSGISLKMTYSAESGRSAKYFSAADILANNSFSVKIDGNATDTSKLTVGKHTVTITYRYPDISCSFEINVRERTLVSLVIDTEPNSLTVFALDKVPSLDGLKILAKYDNGEQETLTASDCTVKCNLPLHYGSGNIVTLSYKTQTISLDFTARILEEKRLKLTLPQVLTFILGEEIDLSALKVEIEYTDGSVKEVTDYEISKIEPLNTEKLGQDVVVTYGKFSEIFTVYIVPYYQRGDIDGDGEVTVKDARYALRQSVGLMELASRPLTAADADKDGSVTVRDARLILRGAVGLEQLPLALYEHG